MELKTQNRVIFGKKTKQLRNAGLIPAEIFGHGFKNEHISVLTKDFSKIFKEAGENTVIQLINEKGGKIPALISDVAFDHLKETVLSVDFHHIRMDEKIQAKVPVELLGDAPATKKGLMIVKVMNEVEVEALPNQIPHRFEVDISMLEDTGQGVYVKELKIPPGVKILAHADAAVVTVAETAKEEAEAAAAPAPVASETPAPEAETTEEKK